MIPRNNFETIITGGSYAGLSAAMALGRSLRKVLVIDSGKPCKKTYMNPKTLKANLRSYSDELDVQLYN